LRFSKTPTRFQLHIIILELTWKKLERSACKTPLAQAIKKNIFGGIEYDPNPS
jgi:hypothetical protein